MLPRISVFTLALLCLTLPASAADNGAGTYTDPAAASKEDPDFALQGEYSGHLKHKDGEAKVGIQVIALGKGKFRAVGYVGGLPGDGWNKKDKHSAEGQVADGAVTFKGDEGIAVLNYEGLTIKSPDGEAVGTLKKVERKSPTLGMAPPQGAVVLYSKPEDAENWNGGKADEQGLLQQGVTSRETFGSHTLHVEFRLPYMPTASGQGRGNSGLYLQGRYEVQMLDSFGLEGKQNECGGIYSVAEPDQNMCYPPLAWQTYDVDYTAAKFGDDGKVVSSPRVTVRHNGVVIHDNVELPADRSTTAAPVKPGAEPGPVYLQNHGNPVRYRNIWVVKK
ncbi:MAG: DUF1080 domain-containing protein [Planctomycetales bacterium]|nr:DUF1080 domain-containing protein [Planctomycetales bacterium]